jgi:integration host factor subunit alpha
VAKSPLADEGVIAVVVLIDAKGQSTVLGITMAGKTVTREDLYEAAYRTVRLSRTESATLVELVLKEIRDCLARGEAVKLSSFGSFVVRQKPQRMGRNPKTGKEVPIAPRRVVVFKASAILRQKINSPAEGPSHRDKADGLQPSPELRVSAV